MPRWWRRVVDALQVETQGKYSAPRVAELAAYRRQTSTLEALAVLVLTTLPCVTVTVLMGAVPLARPAEGLDANWRFLLHLLVAFWLFAAIATVQFAHYLPSLPISGARIALHSVVVAVCSVGSLYAIGCATGFPVPFTFVVVTPVWAAVIVALLWIAWGRRIRANPALWRLIFSSFVVWVSQLLLTYIYPTYFYVYTLLPPVGRVGFAFLLPVIKLIVRAVLAQSVVHLRNELPEIIVFNAELFNSLFVMYCMQNSPSLLTTAGLMAVDFAQSALALHDINHIFKDIKALHTKANDLAVGTGRRRRDDFLEMAERILKDGQEQRVTSKRAWTATVAPLITSIQGRLSSQAWMSYGSRAQIFPLLQPTRRSTEATGSAVQLTFAKGSVEERYVDALLRLLYMTEFLMLLNYVEVIIPSIYCESVRTLAHHSRTDTLL